MTLYVDESRFHTQTLRGTFPEISEEHFRTFPENPRNVFRVTTAIINIQCHRMHVLKFQQAF